MNEDQIASAPAPAEAATPPVEATPPAEVAAPAAPAAETVAAVETAAPAPTPAPEGAPASETKAEPKEGDVCDVNGQPGHLTRLNDGSLQGTADPVLGTPCKCPDGRDGVYGLLDDTGTVYCIPFQG